MHLKNSFWQIQMLSEGYSGYSGYSYVSSCIENGILSLVRCTGRVRFTGRVAEGKHSADSCGRSTCHQLSLIKRVLLITDRATTPRHRWKRLFEALRGNMVWPFSRFPENHGFVSLAKFQSLFFWGDAGCRCEVNSWYYMSIFGTRLFCLFPWIF